MNPSVLDGKSGEKRKVSLLPQTVGLSDRRQNSSDSIGYFKRPLEST